MLAALAAVGLAASAQDADASTALALSYPAALTAVADHPLLDLHRRHVDARTAVDRDLSGLVLGPQAQLLGGLRVTDEGEDLGFDGQLNLSKGFYLAPVKGRQRAAAANERAALAAASDAARLELGLQAARAWTGLWAAEARLAVVAEAIALAEREDAVIARALEVGLRSATELAEHRVHVETTTLLRVDAEGERYEAEVELARALAHRGPTLTAVGPLPEVDLPPEAAWDALVERIDRLPFVRAALDRRRAARARREAAEGQTAPVLRPTLSAQREAPDQWIGWAGVGVALTGGAMRARTRGGQIDDEQAAARAEVEARVGARAELRLVLHEVEHARERLARYDDRVLPAARRAVEVGTRATEVGETSTLVVLRARRRLLELELERVEAARRRAEAEARAALFLAALAAPEVGS